MTLLRYAGCRATSRFRQSGHDTITMDATANAVSLLIEAISFAAEKHRNQRRKDASASPYINHPIALADVLANEGRVTDIDVLCAAVLHDTIEDTETTVAELENRFGPRIASIVVEVTDDKSLPKQVRKQLQIENAASANHPKFCGRIPSQMPKTVITTITPSTVRKQAVALPAST